MKDARDPSGAVAVIGAILLLATVVVVFCSMLWPSEVPLICDGLGLQQSVTSGGSSVKNLDLAGATIVVVGAIVTVLTFAVVRTTLFPGESSSHHPKRSIMREDR